MDRAEAIALLMRIHYSPAFVKNKQFWYDRDLQEADKLICVAASNLRKGFDDGPC